MSGEGKLIVLEGIDDAVLSVQAERLFHWLREQGIAVEQTREPTHGPAGAQIRLVQQGRLQIDPATLALFRVADRMDHLRREDGVLSWLAAGRYVVCVRYLLFSYAHQWDQVNAYASRRLCGTVAYVEWDWLRQINALCRVPDLALFIDTPTSFAATGCASELARLRQSYLNVIKRLQSEGESIEIIGGRSTADEIHRACLREVARLLHRRPSVEGA